MVDDAGFHAFLTLACPEYDPPSQPTIAKYIRRLYEDEKESDGDMKMRSACLAVNKNK